MPDSSVSSCVLNILGSFSSSLGLYKKLREKRRKKKHSKTSEPCAEQELRLSRSLRQGPEDISREYQQSIHAVGDQFAIGDAIAQTCLAEILLRLNVGLIGIITSFLDHDKNNVHLDYKGLADLSDRSRVDTCRALRQLYKRLTQLTPRMAITSREIAEAVDDKKPTHDSDVDKNGSKVTASRAKIRGTTLAQVVVQDSSKPPQIALVRPGDRRKKSRSSSASESSLSKARSDAKSYSQATTPPPEYTTHQPRRREPERANTAPDVRKPHRKHSAANITSKTSARSEERPLASKSTPRLQSSLQEPVEPLPPPPNTAPMPYASTPALVPRRRTMKPTPTYYSIATDSTKLGEIPLHKWTCQPDFDQMSALNHEAYRNGWPNDPANLPRSRRRPALFGFLARRSL